MTWCIGPPPAKPGAFLRARHSVTRRATQGVLAISMPPTAIRRCLIPLSWCYGAAVGLRVRLYRAGVFPRRRLPCRVISIGNLTVGGTGKTPVAIFVVSALIERGLRVGLLSRGYGRETAQPMALVSDGQRVLLGPGEGGDEPVLIAHRCPRAVVAVGSDRFALGRWVLDRTPIDVFVLDDGYQHLGLERDVDLLLFDAGAPASLDALLPAGRLREPLTAAARASAFLITRGEDRAAAGEILSRLTKAGAPARPSFRLRLFPEAVTDVEGQPAGIPSDLAGRRAIVASGLANPAAFLLEIERLGVTVATEHVWPDHHAYSASDVDRLLASAASERCDLVLTTEKDAVKLRRVAQESPLRALVRVLRLGIEVVEGGDEWNRLLMGGMAAGERVVPASSNRSGSLY